MRHVDQCCFGLIAEISAKIKIHGINFNTRLRQLTKGKCSPYLIPAGIKQIWIRFTPFRYYTC